MGRASSLAIVISLCSGLAGAEVTAMSKGAALCLGRIAETLASARSIKVLEVSEEGIVRGLVSTDIVFNVIDRHGVLAFRTGTCKIRTGGDGGLSIEEFFLPFVD